MSAPPNMPQDQRTQNRSLRWIAILAAALVVVFALVFARFTFFSGKGAVEGPGSIASLGQPSPVATATQFNSSGNGTNGTVVPGQTPAETPVIPGYPAPNVISPYEQGFLDQATAQYGKQESKIIYVSLDGQFIQALQNGKIVRWAYVITGRGTLPTNPGFWQIFLKDSPLVFLPQSRDPRSPLFGYNSNVQYGMEYQEGGFYIHDAWWHTVYGPGLNFDHYDPGRVEYQEGSHGCVNTPLEMEAFLYQWAPLGTPVIIQ
jgi:lipoprotein-anchoring transpeptidase ErfK/SrfK